MTALVEVYAPPPAHLGCGALPGCGQTALLKKAETKEVKAICPAPSAASQAWLLLAMEEDDGTHLEPFATLIIISGPEPSVPAVPPLKPVTVIYCGSAFLSLFFFFAFPYLYKSAAFLQSTASTGQRRPTSSAPPGS